MSEQEVLSMIESEQKLPSLHIVPVSLRQHCPIEHIGNFIFSHIIFSIFYLTEDSLSIII